MGPGKLPGGGGPKKVPGGGPWRVPGGVGCWKSGRKLDEENWLQLWSQGVASLGPETRKKSLKSSVSN